MDSVSGQVEAAFFFGEVDELGEAEKTGALGCLSRPSPRIRWWFGYDCAIKVKVFPARRSCPSE